jgi:hypothetical protein
MIVRYLSRFYGDPNNDYSNWEFPVMFGTVLASGYWVLFFAGWTLHIPYIGLITKITLGALVIGFVLSSFSGIEDKKRRIWALVSSTILLPGLLVVVIFTHVVAGIYWFLHGLLRIQDGLLFLQELFNGGVVKRWKERREKKRKEKDAKLKVEAEKIRVSGGGGAYRAAFLSCKECGQELPRIEDDGKKFRRIIM